MAKVSPEEQQMLEDMLIPLLEMLYDNNGQSTVEQLQVTDDPVDDAGNLVGNLLIEQQKSARQNQKMIPPKVVFGMAQQLANNITDIGVAAGLIDEAESNDAAEAAMFIGMNKYGEASQQMGLSPEERQEYAQMLQEIEQARGMTNGESGQMSDQGMEQGPPQGGDPGSEVVIEEENQQSVQRGVVNG